MEKPGFLWVHGKTYFLWIHGKTYFLVGTWKKTIIWWVHGITYFFVDTWKNLTISGIANYFFTYPQFGPRSKIYENKLLCKKIKK